MIFLPSNRGILQPSKQRGFLLNPSRFAAAGPATVWDSAKINGACALSNGNLTATSGGSQGRVAGNNSRSSGKHYFEYVMTAWSGSANLPEIGLTGIPGVAPSAPGNNPGVGYRKGGAVRRNAVTVGTYAGYVAGNVIGVAIDLTGLNVWFAVNNVWINSGNPAAGTNPSASSLTAGTYFPAVGLNAGGESVTARFTSASHSYSPPSGFSTWDP